MDSMEELAVSSKTSVFSPHIPLSSDCLLMIAFLGSPARACFNLNIGKRLRRDPRINNSKKDLFLQTKGKIRYSQILD